MRVDVVMPKMGESITEGTILSWAKSKGDKVEKDESILEISTDKVDTEVPAPASGTLIEILAAEGDTVDVGTKIAVIATEGEDEEGSSGDEEEGESSKDEDSGAESKTEKAPKKKAKPAKDAKTGEGEEEPQEEEEDEEAGEEEPEEDEDTEPDEDEEEDEEGDEDEQADKPAREKAEGKRFYSPVVMRIASEKGIGMDELEAIDGSGSNGRVTKKDIADYLETRGESRPASKKEAAGKDRPARKSESAGAQVEDDVEVVPMDNIKRLMAEHMVKSVAISPHVTLVAEIDMTKIVNYRIKNADGFKKREGISLTFMPFIAQAAVKALKDFPYMNSSIDGTNIRIKRNTGLGIAVAMENGGLIVPVVKGADTMNLAGLAHSISDVAKRARTKRLQPDEIQGGTFTITNFGVFGSTFGTPIINQPQVGILGVGAIVKRPVVIEANGEDTIAIRSIMFLSITFDHRLIDGAYGGQYLERVKKYLESFNQDAM